MARRLNTERQIDRYIDNIANEARHHAQAVQDAIWPLAKAVRLKLNLGTDKIEIYERNGNLARTCWVTIGGRRCAFSYDYPSQKIVIRDRSLQGRVIFQCDNSTAVRAITRAINDIWH